MKYILSENFVLRNVAGEYILLSRGADTLECNSVTVFNETGALLYQSIKEYTSVDSLANVLVEKYGIPFVDAKNDAQAFVNKMVEHGILRLFDM